jgi:DNA-binding beta-propeller fold protein YncE
VAAGAPRSCGGASAARPLSKVGQGATVALAKVGGKTVTFVADEDAKAILTFDVDGRTQLAETPVGGAPAQVWVASDGRVFAGLRDRNELAVFAATRADAPLAKLCGAATPAEPVALAATPDESTVLVTAGFGRRLAAFDAAPLAAKFEVATPREPRSVVVADDGKTAFVSHAVGSLVSAVDLAGAEHEVAAVSTRGVDLARANELRQRGEVVKRLERVDPKQAARGREQLALGPEPPSASRPSCQGFALAKSAEVPGRVFAPQALVDPGDVNQRPEGYGDLGLPTESSAVAVIDEGARATLAPSVTADPRRRMTFVVPTADPRPARAECLLPRAAAVDGQTKTLLVTCYGIDAVVAYDATAADPQRAERRRWVVGAGPSGVAVDPERHRAVVWSQFDRTVSTFAIGAGEPADEKAAPPSVQKTALPAPREAPPPDYVLGRILFHAAGDLRIASDGRACASCHPDGRDDGITWATPDGPRRSIALAGRAAASSPYSWNGGETTLHSHLGNTFERLSGRGLRSVELDALVAYIARLPTPTPAPPADAAKVARGRAVFASAEAGCATCHAGAALTDGKNHDVGSKHDADRSAAFNTPSLRFVGAGGPYFHDGRYATLGEMLRTNDGPMGRAKGLPEPDLDALEAYLRSL